MNYQRCFIVRVNGAEVARHKGHFGGAYQVATNHAYDLYTAFQEKAMAGETEYADYEVTVNGRNIKDII
ncbi:MAG: hypothetical protein NC102_10445 [Clostridium sp.]|nr:hypothetical protein [Clostridium sp.]